MLISNGAGVINILTVPKSVFSYTFGNSIRFSSQLISNTTNNIEYSRENKNKRHKREG